MTTRLRYQSILTAGVFLLLACGELPDFPEADRPVEPGPQPAQTAAALAGLQAGGASGSVGVLMLSGTRW
jgi:hypothetical protein